MTRTSPPSGPLSGPPSRPETLPVLKVEGLRVRKQTGRSVFLLDVPDLEVGQGERRALVGPSGCGKSSLLDALGLIEPPLSCHRFVLGGDGASRDLAPDLSRRDETMLAAVRAHCLGYVLQRGGLLPFLTARANIALPLRLLRREDPDRVEALAEALGVRHRLEAHPRDLSIGERQRVAVARALVARPLLVLADEPTAALDPENGDAVMRLLLDLSDATGTAVIVASHDTGLLDRFGFLPYAQHCMAAGDTTTARFWSARPADPSAQTGAPMAMARSS